MLHLGCNIRLSGIRRGDFRTICLGDLYLLNEIRLDEGGVVNRQRGLCPARRIYSARIRETQLDMTVAVYEGENAEEVCLSLSGTFQSKTIHSQRLGSANWRNIPEFGELKPRSREQHYIAA